MKSSTSPCVNHLRLYNPHKLVSSHSGNNWRTLWARAIARCFGMSIFIVLQTLFALSWVLPKGARVLSFDIFPPHLPNTAIILQSSCAAPPEQNTSPVAIPQKHKEHIHGMRFEMQKQFIKATA